MSFDFTLEKYRELMAAMVGSGYRVLTVGEYLTEKNTSPPFIVLRHDVDRRPENALKMARAEHEFSVTSTYYFRKTPNAFRPAIVEGVSQLGHEIGYHYETLVKSKGDVDKAAALFEKELEAFRAICHVETICMHGSPLSKWDNRDLWNTYDFRNYGIKGEAYLSVDFEAIVYLSDTGRTWHSQKFNIRDRRAGLAPPDIERTDELIRILGSKGLEKVYLLVHPNRWADGKFELYSSALSDVFLNYAKVFIHRVRN